MLIAHRFLSIFLKGNHISTIFYVKDDIISKRLSFKAGGEGMSRRKGLKQWDVITREGWLSLMGNPAVMSHLMMDIFDRLYDSRDHMDNAKNIAGTLHMEYRALNAGVGWAGSKIREMMEDGLLDLYPDADLAEPVEEVLSPDMEEGKKKVSLKRAPWEYVFDGTVGDDGIYFWILKPEAASAYREIREARDRERTAFTKILAEDESSLGVEGSLFARSPDVTVKRIQQELDRERDFQRKSMVEEPCCLVCGARRISLLKAYPYEEEDRKTKGLFFCPTHGALFAAHLISFSDKGQLIISESLSEEERNIYGLKSGDMAKAPFKRRRMAVHRKIFNQEARKTK